MRVLPTGWRRKAPHEGGAVNRLNFRTSFTPHRELIEQILALLSV
jgi:hypothetical protein